MVSPAATDRVSCCENEEDPRIYHVFITNLLIRRVRRLTPLSRDWQDGRIGGSRPLEGCIGEIYRSFGTRKKPRRLNNHNGLAHFLRILVVGQPEEKGPMPQAARTRSEERLPLSTAILSNIALSLLMWNIALRLASLFLAA